MLVTRTRPKTGSIPVELCRGMLSRGFAMSESDAQSQSRREWSTIGVRVGSRIMMERNQGRGHDPDYLYTKWVLNQDRIDVR